MAQASYGSLDWAPSSSSSNRSSGSSNDDNRGGRSYDEERLMGSTDSQDDENDSLSVHGNNGVKSSSVRKYHRTMKTALLGLILSLLAISALVLFRGSSSPSSHWLSETIFKITKTSGSEDSGKSLSSSSSSSSKSGKSIAGSSSSYSTEGDLAPSPTASKVGYNQGTPTVGGGGTPTYNAVPTIVEPPTSDDEVGDMFTWTLARDGYDALVLDDEVFQYKFLQEYDAVIEPYSAMQLVINDYNTTLNESLLYYKWSLCPSGEMNKKYCTYGQYSPYGYPSASETANVSCAAYDEYDIYVTEYDAVTGDMLRISAGTGLCLYVRREIRSLTESDLDNVLDAMYALWAYEQEEGQEIYGRDFNNQAVLLKFHHFNSAWQDADHIHEGQAFLPQHIKMTNVFEKSMQSVDPSVALPYWDFTIESSNSTALYNSMLFTPEVFGSMPNCTDYWWGFTYENDEPEWAAIPDGRWAYIEAEMNTDYDDLLAGFGYMRAPWSMNPSPYVSRFTSDWKIGTTLPTCLSHYKMLEYTTFTDFMMEAGDDPHSSAHSLIGGVYGCDLFRPLIFAGFITGHTEMMTICGSWSFILKELYRNNYILPWSNCTTTDDDLSESVCGFDCQSTDDVQTLLQALIEADTGPLTDRGWTAWSDFVCSGNGFKVFPGDHLESASPSDPSFWPMHPTLERLMHAKYMSGGFENETWNSDSETQNVCHHASCYESDYNATAFFPQCCYGHYQYDQMLDALTGNKLDHWGPTNDATVKGSNPTSDQYIMPYIYDSFSWDHCADIGVDIQGLLEAFYDEYFGTDDDIATSLDIVGNLTDDGNSTSNSTWAFSPTPLPTVKPTRSPDATHKPTYEPTFKPTRSPDATHKPTYEDTFAPTYEPTSEEEEEEEEDVAELSAGPGTTTTTTSTTVTTTKTGGGGVSTGVGGGTSTTSTTKSTGTTTTTTSTTSSTGGASSSSSSGVGGGGGGGSSASSSSTGHRSSSKSKSKDNEDEEDEDKDEDEDTSSEGKKDKSSSSSNSKSSTRKKKSSSKEKSTSKSKKNKKNGRRI